MTLTIRILGVEWLSIELLGAPKNATPAAPEDRGTTTSTPVGYAPSPGDQRWERGADTI